MHLNPIGQSKSKEQSPSIFIFGPTLSSFDILYCWVPYSSTFLFSEFSYFFIEISSLEKDIKTLEKEVLDVNSAVEQYYKEMFEECVAGEDRVKLQKTIEDNGLSYSVIIIYINESLRISQEKK